MSRRAGRAAPAEDLVSSHPSSHLRSKKRIGFVELPDHSVDVLVRYSQRPAWHIAVVVSRDSGSEAAQIAAKLGIPVLETPHRAALASCDRIVVGNQNLHLFVSVKELLRGSAVEVLRLSQLADFMEREEVPRSGPAEPAPSASMPTAVPDPTEPPPLPEPADEAAEPADEAAEPVAAAEAAEPAKPSAESLPTPAAFAALAPTQPGAGDQKVAEELFHPASLLGGDVRGCEGIALDTQHPALLEILDRAIEVTDAKTSSIMLVDTDGGRLRIASARGISESTVNRLRQRIGEGVAGTVFATHNPMTERGQFPSLAEEDGRPVYRVAASVPITASGKPIGVLSINAESTENLLDKKVLNPLTRLARRLPGIILAAVDLSHLPGPARWEALRLQIDRLMTLDHALPDRLGAVGEAVRKALHAETAHFFLVDPHRRRLHSAHPPKGMGHLADRTPTIDSGLFGWVLRHDKPCAFELTDDKSGETVVTVMCPLGVARGRSLLVLENVPLAGVTKDEVLAAVREIAGQVEGIVDIEEGVAVQELLAEIKMRIADESEHINRQPPERRMGSFLELVLTMVAAESAIWIPADGGMPMATQPDTLEAARVLSQAWEKLESLVDWVHEKGAEAEGAVATEFDKQAPPMPAPYVGVIGPDGESVLIVFFSSQREGTAGEQLPAQVLWQILNRICELIPPGLTELRAGSSGRIAGYGTGWAQVRNQGEHNGSAA